jgi:translocation and assembly module TamB
MAAVTARLRSLLVGVIVGLAAMVSSLTGMLLLLVVGVVGLVQTQDGRDMLARSVEWLLSEPGGSAVRITGLAPGLPARLSVDRIEMGDASGSWLAVTDFLLAWRPSALLAGRVHVDDVLAARISLERLPPPSEEPEASEPVTPPHLPQLPVAVRIDRLSVSELRLAEAVAGRPMRLGIEGRLAAADDAGDEAGHLRTSIAVLPLDAGGGAVLLDADVDPKTRVLELAASVDEPEGGLVGSLLGLQPRTPLAARLDGRGPFEHWKGSFMASAGGLGRFTSDLVLSWSRDLRLTVAGNAAIEPALLPQLAPVLADGLRVQTTVRQDADGSLAIEALELAGHDLRLTGDGALDADGALSFQADLSIDKGAIAPGSLGAVRFERASVHAVASGTMQAPAVTAKVTVVNPAGPGAQVKSMELQAKASLLLGESEATRGGDPTFAAAEISGALAGLQLADPFLQAALGEAPVFGAKAGVDAAKTRLTVPSLTVDGRSARLAGEGSVGLHDRKLVARANLQATDLRAVAAPAGSAASGSANLAATLEGTLEPMAITGRIEAEAKKLATGIPAADALIGPEPRVEAPFSWSETEGLDAPELRLEARHVSGDGHLRLTAKPEDLDARLRLSVPSLAPVSAAAGNPLRGRMTLQAAARGAPADPQAEVVVRLSDAAVGDVTIAAANATLRVADAVSRPAGRLTLDGTTSIGPISGSADFELENNRWLRVEQLAGRGLGLALDGQVQADLAGPVASGRLQASSQPPETNIRFDETELWGPIRIDVRLAPQGGRQIIGVNLTGGPLSLRQGSGEQLGLAGINGDAMIHNAFADPQFTANLQASEISGPLALHRLALNAAGTPAEARLTLAAEGGDAGLQRLEAVATVAQREDAVRVDLEQLQGRLAGEALRLSQPARVIAAPARLSLAGLTLAVGDGRVSADAVLSPGNTAMAMRAESLPVGMARVFSDAAPAHGTLNAAFTLRTEQGQTVGGGDIRLRGVGFDQAGTSNEARLDADLDLQLGAGALRMDGVVSALAGTPLTLRGNLPVRLPAGETTPIVDRAAPIEGRLGIDADLRRLSLLLALNDQRIEGTVAGEVVIGGSLVDPVLGGGIDLRDGLYENFVSATLLSGLSARLEPRDRRTLALRLAGTDGGEGHIAAEGGAALLPEGGTRARLALQAEDATLIRRDDVTATLNLDITIDNHGEAPKLSGRIESRQIDIRLLDRLPPSVIVLPVKEVGQARVASRDAGEVAAPVAVGLDLSVSLPRKVFVRGRGLESEWSGELAVTGASGEPRISGEVSLVRGTLTLAGKRFDLQRGVVSFTGSEKIDPLINAVAQYSSTEITALITITGFASQPEITITSQPPLPQSEVLSRVLFNKSSAKLGPVEAVQLAAALEALARGESTGEDVFSFVRTFLGLDTLAVQPSRSGEGSSLALGSYVSDQIYIGAEQGLADGSKTGSVEIEIAPGISVESELNQSATNGTQGALGLKWKWDY